MEQKEISLCGPRVCYMYKFMIDHGATFLRKEDNKYIFIDDNNFKKAFSELEVEIRKGFFNAKEVNDF